MLCACPQPSSAYKSSELTLVVSLMMVPNSEVQPKHRAGSLAFWGGAPRAQVRKEWVYMSLQPLDRSEGLGQNLRLCPSPNESAFQQDVQVIRG